MADIELVIRINKEVVEAFDKAKKENALSYYMNVYKDDLYNAIKNGTPLPKCHGRLIDADAFLKDNDDYTGWILYSKAWGGENGYKDALEDLVAEAQTIIEADKESEDMEQERKKKLRDKKRSEYDFER